MVLSVVDLEVAEYWLRKSPHQNALLTQTLSDQGIRWKISIEEWYVMGNDGSIVSEPRPSNRDAEFYEKYRFKTAQEGLDVWNKYAPEIDKNDLASFT